MARCEATTAAGMRCRAWAVRGSTRCVGHSPEHRATLVAGARRGGQLRGLALRRPETAAVGDVGNLETVAGLVALVARTLERLTELPLSVQVANSVGQLVTVQLRALEGGDFERRLAALENALQRSSNAGTQTHPPR